MKIILASDAYRGLASGVWVGDKQLYKILDKRGHKLFFFDTLDTRHMRDITHTVGYIGLPSQKKFAKFYEAVQPDAVHIVSEAFVGLSVRNFCVNHGIPFTTAFHTNLDMILSRMLKIPQS